MFYLLLAQNIGITVHCTIPAVKRVEVVFSEVSCLTSNILIPVNEENESL